MDPELFSDFIAEAREHLETIEPNLLELEKEPQNLELLNEIFRPMHSLKGASGFLGLNKINRLAHKAENILDELRKGNMLINSEIMDVILSATDALRHMIDNVEASMNEGDVDIETIYGQIDAIMNGESAGSAPSATSEAAAPAAEAPPLAPEPAPKPLAPPAAPAPKAQAAATVENTTPQVAPTPLKKKKNVEPTITSKDWISTLENRESYALTAFGEGHLKDFIDEAREITQSLTSGLLNIEQEGINDPELVNDLFRYFHNLKGNSGIIGYHELNSLTHEAETLLNKIRHNEMNATHELTDLLLLVVDVIDTLVDKIEPAAGSATPFDISEILSKLQQAVAGGSVELPAALMPLEQESAEETVETPATPTESTTEEEIAASSDDVVAFIATIRQQQSIINAAIDQLRKDSSKKEYVDALHRSLVAIQNASSFMKLEEIKVYAERTASLVNQARSSGLDFSLMLDLLHQEVEIIYDLLEKQITRLQSKTDSGASTAGSTAGIVVVPAKSEVTPAAKTATQQSTAKPAVPQPTTVAAPKPIAKPAAPTPKPAAPAPQAAVLSKPIPGTMPKSTPAAPAKPAVKAGEEHKSSSTIRVDHEKLDHLMNLIGELIINRNRYTMLARRLEEPDAANDIGEIGQNLSETTYAMARISDDLQDTIMKVRMVPVASVFSRFPRLVRDLSRKSGKEVELILEGEETELDKSVVEVIGDPLVHLIRNSVDHGIETEAERVAKGKPIKGRVTLRAYHKGNSVAIEVEDDGHGLDPEKLREVAVRKGLMSAEEVRQLDDREARELIFMPGFSSAEKITDISGRGVGMDVVRTNIKTLKGSINISSEVGKGTRFILSLPLTLAIIDALMINVAGEMFAIPLDAVSETTKIEASRLTDVKGRKAVTLRGEVLGIVELAEMLGLPHKELPDVLSVVVIHDNERRLGLVVDRLLERQEIVIKPLGSYLGDIHGISGATIMGDGGVILILDPHEIYTIATSSNRSNQGA